MIFDPQKSHMNTDEIRCGVNQGNEENEKLKNLGKNSPLKTPINLW